MPNYSNTPPAAFAPNSTERRTPAATSIHIAVGVGFQTTTSIHIAMVSGLAVSPAQRGGAEEQREDSHAERRGWEPVGRLGRRAGGIPAHAEQQELSDRSRSAGAVPAPNQIQPHGKQDGPEAGQPGRSGGNRYRSSGSPRGADDQHTGDRDAG